MKHCDIRDLHRAGLIGHCWFDWSTPVRDQTQAGHSNAVRKEKPVYMVKNFKLIFKQWHTWFSVIPGGPAVITLQI